MHQKQTADIEAQAKQIKDEAEDNKEWENVYEIIESTLARLTNT